MFKHKIKSQLIRGLKVIPGWRTSRKIIVFESDDWGSIRMPSAKTYETLMKQGVPVDKCRYNKYDSLADSDDLTALFEVLSSVKDKHGNHAVFTPLVLTANPDFKKIEESGYQKYYYEPLPKTLGSYSYAHQKSFALWLEGIHSGLFKPQFHGREHLNVYHWMNALRANSPEAIKGFQFKTYGLPVSSYTKRKNIFMAAFDFDSEKEFLSMPKIIEDGIDLFTDLFKYTPVAFQAPCGIYSSRLEPVLKNKGIEVIQTGVAHYEPKVSERPNQFKKKLRFFGMRSSYNLLFTLRNCRFEPSENQKTDWVDRCLNDIETAFMWKKPAIISPHRVNFIGTIDPSNRNHGLTALKTLLESIVKKWPKVEFLSSAELAKLIRAGKSSNL